MAWNFTKKYELISKKFAIRTNMDRAEHTLIVQRPKTKFAVDHS